MQRMFSRRPFHVFHLVLDDWIYGTHTHNFYELILVNSGSGNHTINDHAIRFKAGDVFMLTPNDKHSFSLEERTDFTYIKFTELIFKEKYFNAGRESWMKEFTSIFSTSNLMPTSIIRLEKDVKLIFFLAEALFDEYVREEYHSRSLILELFGSILMVLRRNLLSDPVVANAAGQTERNKIHKILSYIRTNISVGSKITIKSIAKEFHMSPSYVSAYIKKHTWISLQKMIIETRLVKGERLLSNSSFTIGEIAAQLGFNDGSHMNKSFQKYRGKNPSDYRKE